MIGTRARRSCAGGSAAARQEPRKSRRSSGSMARPRAGGGGDAHFETEGDATQGDGARRNSRKGAKTQREERKEDGRGERPGWQAPSVFTLLLSSLRLCG